MGSTDGLIRGMDAHATGSAILVTVGENTLGRMFNVLGNPIDDVEAPENVEYMPIHRKAPAFEEQATSTEMLETRNQSCRSSLSLSEGWKNWSVWWSRCRQDRTDSGVDPQYCN